jgi:hypothetical protein
MIPSALDSEKVSPYFRAKNSHDNECVAKLIDTREKYNGRESNVEEVYEKILNTISKKDKAESTPNMNPERKKKEKKNIKVKYLSQLISFCVGNDINEFIGDIQIKDFFIDKRTYQNFDDFEENRIYLVGARYKSYSTKYTTMYFMCPIGVREKEIGVWFKSKDDFYAVKNKIFDKDENDNYKDIYVLAKGTSTNKLKIYNENQFYFIAMKYYEINEEEA